VYLWTKGPTYESAAEIKMMAKMGADAVGMSTVPEILVAKSVGMKTLGISCITNMATGISATKLSHEEVTETANRVKNDFEKLVSAIVVGI
jgi:purine-nucleoside phosphorylase